MSSLRGRPAAIVAAALLAGVLARVWLIVLAPPFAFFGDHVDYVCWGREAVDVGVLALYQTPPGSCPAVAYIDGRPRTMMSGAGERLNYPPLAAYVFWIEGHLHALVDTARTANTRAARAVFALSTTIGELLTAVGVAALVGTYASPVTAAVALAATWLAPPLLADGPFWGQTESWVLAPAVWMVWAMTRQRWMAAGVLWGIALALKPSALLFGPLWAYAFAFRQPRLRILAAGLIGVVVMNVIAAPFWLTSGLAWVQRTFFDNYVYALHWTTMLTFNIWYADLLWNGQLDSRTTVLGITRDRWGTVLLLLGLAAAFAATRRWEQRHPDRRNLAFVPLAALVSLAAVMLPTRVHGTYTAFTTPFLIATALLVPRSWPAASVMIVATTLHILSWQWANLLAVHVLPNESVFPPERQAARRALRARDAPREWALTAVTLAATAAMFVAVAMPPRRRSESDGPRRAAKASRA
jgi:hypothetical protein